VYVNVSAPETNKRKRAYMDNGNVYKIIDGTRVEYIGSNMDEMFATVLYDLPSHVKDCQVEDIFKYVFGKDELNVRIQEEDLCDAYAFSVFLVSQVEQNSDKHRKLIEKLTELNANTQYIERLKNLFIKMN